MRLRSLSPLDNTSLRSLLDTEASHFARRGIGVGKVGLGKRPTVIVIDFQCLFTRGRNSTHRTRAAVEATADLVKAAHSAGVPVTFTRVEYSSSRELGIVWEAKVPGLAKCTPGSEAVKIDPALGLRQGDVVIAKPRASAFFGTELASVLRAQAIDTIVFAGTSTSGCVRASVVDAAQLNFRPLVVRQCVDDRSELSHEVNLADLQSRYADVVELPEVVSWFARLPKGDRAGTEVSGNGQ